MANARIRLTQQTIEAVTELGQKCGIEDVDTVIKLLIRKYGDNLIDLLSPSNPILDSVTQFGTALQPTPQTTLEPSIKSSEVQSTATKTNSKPRTPITGF